MRLLAIAVVAVLACTAPVDAQTVKGTTAPVATSSAKVKLSTLTSDQINKVWMDAGCEEITDDNKEDIPEKIKDACHTIAVIFNTVNDEESQTQWDKFLDDLENKMDKVLRTYTLE